jgi:NADH-quinone oxidoreductase subunit J
MRRGVLLLVVLLVCGLGGVAAAQVQPQPAPQPGPRVQVVPAPGQPGGQPGAPGRIQVVPAPGGAPTLVPIGPGGAAAPGAPNLGAPIAEQAQKSGKGTAAVFWLFAIFAVVGAIATITRKNAISAVMCLVATFFAISGVYVLLLAHFMAAIQVLVYAGAIMVLFVFVVMILNKEEEEPWALRGWFGKALAGGALVYFLVRLVDVLWGVKRGLVEAPWKPGEFAAYGTTKTVGAQLFTNYLFPFEAISIALLIAIVGAVVLAHPDHPTNEGEGARDGEGAKS